MGRHLLTQPSLRIMQIQMGSHTGFDFPQGLMNKYKIIESDRKQMTEV